MRSRYPILLSTALRAFKALTGRLASRCLLARIFIGEKVADTSIMRKSVRSRTNWESTAVTSKEPSDNWRSERSVVDKLLFSSSLFGKETYRLSDNVVQRSARDSLNIRNRFI